MRSEAQKAADKKYAAKIQKEKKIRALSCQFEARRVCARRKDYRGTRNGEGGISSLGDFRAGKNRRKKVLIPRKNGGFICNPPLMINEIRWLAPLQAPEHT